MGVVTLHLIVGVRIGSSEIYQVVQTVSGVQDSLVVHLDREDLVFYLLLWTLNCLLMSCR